MSSQKFKAECSLHHSEAIAINIHPNKDQKDIIKCIYCLVSDSCEAIIPIKDIKILIENFLVQEKQRKLEISEIKQSFQIKLLDKLILIKKEIINLLDNGINIIKDQLQSGQQSEESLIKIRQMNETSLKEQINYIMELQNSYCQQQNKLNDLSWTQSLLEEIQQINRFHEIQNIIDLLHDFRKEYQIKNDFYTFDKLLQNESDSQKCRNNQSNKTPKLNIICQNHEKEIIMINMNKNIDKIKRLCCIECMPEKYWSLTQCKNKWTLFQEQKRISLQQQILDIEAQYYQVRDQNMNIELQIIEQLKLMRIQFEDYLAIKKKSLFSKVNLDDEDWINLPEDEILQRAEILSKLEECQDQINQMEFQQIADQVLKLMQEQFKALKVYQQNFYDNLRSSLCHSQQISKSVSSSDQNCLNEQQQILINVKGNLIRKTQKNQEQYIFQSCENNTYLNFQDIKDEGMQNKSKFSSPKGDDQNDNKIDQEYNEFEDYTQSQYQIISRYRQEQNCYAISFNFNSTIMISGCQNDIIVWDFNYGKLQKLQTLQGHSNQVISLKFSENKNEFVSGSTDKSIRYWQQINNLWLCQQVLLGHKRQIDCLLMSNINNQLLSCSCDKTIRIWRKNQQSQWIQIQNLTNHSAYVRCISLNKSQNLFVSCGEDKMIFIWELNKSKVWSLKQSIQDNDYGYRICFLGDLKIAWQPRNTNKTLFYQYIARNDQFELERNQIRLQESNEGYQNFFPSIYNEFKQVFVNKHGQFVYILKMDEATNLEISQIIDIGHYCNYGSLSKDGQYLVIWDEKSKCLILRQAKF